MKIRQKLLLIVTILLCHFSLVAEARWATPDEAIIATEMYNHIISINADGTYKEEIELQEKILKEAGRERAAKYSLYYNGDSSKLKIVSAKTIFNGKEYQVPKNNIEDKPLASSGQAFDHIKQVFIAFPNAEVGAQIYLKFERKLNKPDLDNVFSMLYQFGNDFEENSNLKIHSELPLHLVVNDPNKVLKVVKDTDDNFHKLEIILKQPIYTEAVNEPNNSVINLKYKTWISLSSLQDWKELAIKESPSYEKVINQVLPEMFATIVSAAKKEADELQQINIVTSGLNEKIQYLGDWRSIDGRFKPRDLAKIAETQVGDCKDLSASAAAILKKLGYKVQVALVRRGELSPSDLNVLPYAGAFNHAMLKVTNKQNQVYWIDPTNFISMAAGIFPDIENKMALILDSQEPSYEKIPAIDFKHSVLESNRVIEIKNDLVEDYCDVTLKGETAIGMTGAALNASKKMIEDKVFQIVSGTNIEEKNRKNIELPDLHSRIIKDLNFRVHYEQKNLTFKTNLGRAYPLKSDWAEDFVDIASDDVGEIYIGPPNTRKKRILFKNIRVNDIESLNYHIVSPWLIASRQCNPHEEGLEIIESIEVLKSFIPNEELKTDTFINLQDAIKQNVKNTAVVFN